MIPQKTLQHIYVYTMNLYVLYKYSLLIFPIHNVTSKLKRNIV